MKDSIPRALKNQLNDHKIEFEIQRDERVLNHLQNNAADSMNLMFYDFNGCENT